MWQSTGFCVCKIFQWWPDIGKWQKMLRHEDTNNSIQIRVPSYRYTHLRVGYNALFYYNPCWKMHWSRKTCVFVCTCACTFVCTHAQWHTCACSCLHGMVTRNISHISSLGFIYNSKCRCDIRPPNGPFQMILENHMTLWCHHCVNVTALQWWRWRMVRANCRVECHHQVWVTWQAHTAVVDSTLTHQRQTASEVNCTIQRR